MLGVSPYISLSIHLYGWMIERLPSEAEVGDVGAVHTVDAVRTQHPHLQHKEGTTRHTQKHTHTYRYTTTYC